MQNLHEVSKHYLKLVADADRAKNTELLIQVQGGRNIYFWDARKFARELGIDDYELDEVVRFLSERGLLYWRHNYDAIKTVELTEKGFNWEVHESLLEPEERKQPVENRINIVDNRGIIAIESVLKDVAQSVETAPTLSDTQRKQLAELFSDLQETLANTPASHAEQAEVVADQAKEISDELQRPRPRDAMLRIKGSGLVEAAKALGEVLPTAIGVARKIAELVANPGG